MEETPNGKLLPRPPALPPAKVLVQQFKADYERVLKENEVLKKKLKQKEHDLLEIQRQSMSAAAIAAVATAAATVTSADPGTSPPPQQPARLQGALPRPPNIETRIPHTSLAHLHRQPHVSVVLIPKLLDGSSALWRIPFNGRRPAERRILSVALSRTAPRSRHERQVKFVDSFFPGQAEGQQAAAPGSPRGQGVYLKMPLSLCWYPSEPRSNHEDPASSAGTGDATRELVLSQQTHVILGHASQAFHKLGTRGGPLPRAELCFSVVTATRTLDLAAETRQEAEEWIMALQALLTLLPQPSQPSSPLSPHSSASHKAAHSPPRTPPRTPPRIPLHTIMRLITRNTTPTSSPPLPLRATTLICPAAPT